MRDEISLYRGANVRPFGINPAGADSHRKYAEHLGLPFVLLSDSERGVSEAFGVLKSNGKSLERTVYLVGQDGRIRFASRGAPGAAVSLEPLGNSA